MVFKKKQLFYFSYRADISVTARFHNGFNGQQLLMLEKKFSMKATLKNKNV